MKLLVMILCCGLIGCQTPRQREIALRMQMIEKLGALHRCDVDTIVMEYAVALAPEDKQITEEAANLRKVCK